MKLQGLSDLHIDLIRSGKLDVAQTDADVVVLAGDIHNGTLSLDWAPRHFPHEEVVFLAGNHEFYRQCGSALKVSGNAFHLHRLNR